MWADRCFSDKLEVSPKSAFNTLLIQIRRVQKPNFSNQRLTWSPLGKNYKCHPLVSLKAISECQPVSNTELVERRYIPLLEQQGQGTAGRPGAVGAERAAATGAPGPGEAARRYRLPSTYLG